MAGPATGKGDSGGSRVADGRKKLLPWLALALLFPSIACNSPRLRKFFSAGAPFERVFGQLHDDSGTLKVSHYAVLRLPAEAIRAMATGTIEYVRSFDGMGNCLLLRPKKYFSSPNNTTALVQLPKPGALIIGYCNLDESEVGTAVEALYTSRLSATEAGPARAHFLNHDEGFTTIDVTADDNDFTLSSALGRAVGDRLFVASYIEPGESLPRRYANPMPYLAGAITPATTLDSVAPSIAEVVVQTSASGTFAADLASSTVSGGAISGEVARTWIRVAIRADEKTTGAGMNVIPYRVAHELRRVTLSGTTVVASEVKSRGVALFNTVEVAQATSLAAKLYGAAAPAASDPTSGTFYVFLPWNAVGTDTTDDDEGPPTRNALDPAGPVALDLSSATDGVPQFPSGTYELDVTVVDAVNAPAKQTIRFSLAAGGTPPGDAEISFSPISGPVGTEVTLTAATASAFVNGETTVRFTGIFDPDGTSLTGQDLAPTSSFTLDYPADKIRVMDGTHLGLRVGEILPPVSVLASSTMQYGHGGRLLGSVRIQTPSVSFDHTVTSFSFAVVPAMRFGQVVNGQLTPLDPLPIMQTTSAAAVAAAPDYQRLVAEVRFPKGSITTAPPTIDVIVHTVSQSGAAIDTQPHTLGLVGIDDDFAVYRSGVGSTRRLVFVSGTGLAGPQGTNVLALRAEPGGGVWLDGQPPP